MDSKKKVFLLDAYALIFRGYYAFIKNPIVNSKGIDTSAIFGFMNSLLELIRKESPNYLAVAFDKGASVDRVGIFKEYKANRGETPEAIKIATPYIQNILKAMNIPILEKEGFEADDIIGTLAKQAEKKGFEVFMVTPDKDFAQLVSDKVFMYKPARMGNGVEIWGVDEVKEKFEVSEPIQVIDYLGMMGDSVDNIPGLPGVGDKTAKKFLKEFGSMEKLFENTDTLKGKQKENVENNQELGLLSKKLATIILDVPVEFDEVTFKHSDPNTEEVLTIFKELEFRRITENFLKTYNKDPEKPKPPVKEKTIDLFSSQETETQVEPTLSPYKNLENTSHFYQHIPTLKGVSLLVEKLLAQKSVCFDTETTGLNALTAKLVGIAFSWEAHKGYYVSIPEEAEEAQKIIEILRPFFESETIEKIGHNIKYDYKVLLKYDIKVKAPFFDTMLAHYLLNPDMRHNMDSLALSYLNYNPQSITELIGKKGKNQKSMREVAIDMQTEYAVEDADITFQLKNIFEPQLNEKNVLSVFKDVEIPLIEVLATMEAEGVLLDTPFLAELSTRLEEKIVVLEEKIYTDADEKFNLSSPKQLGIVLFEKLKLVEKPKKTKTGQYATSEEVLSYLAKDHDIIKNILDWRTLQKLQSTYVKALPREINPDTKRIHTEYHQAVAATGRLSSNNPNLQNIPIRTELGQEVRKSFVPRDSNHILMAADYSQIELRIIASLSGDENMLEAFKNNEDIHRSTASKVFKTPLEDITKAQRSYAKTVNFGIIYGVSAFGLSQQTNLTRSESKQIIDAYYESYPKLKEYISIQKEYARQNGYVETILGRRRYLKDILSNNHTVRSFAERNAVNAPIQGSAADIIKLAMIQIYQKMTQENWQSKMILQVHDELVFDVHREELEDFKKMVVYEMERAYKLNVPLVVDVGVGANWLEAH